jgi:tRNA threonylcarbamoyladenosine biosynthesis protein TsaB
VRIPTKRLWGLGKEDKMLLAIDTATRLAGLALCDQAKRLVLAEETWHSTDNHTVELMPRLVRLLEQQGLAPSDLTGIVISLGPGSFTGLRIGLGLAKGLALAQGLPIVGVPTLDVVAQPHKTQRLPIWAILQAGRGRICAGHYTRSKEHWRREGSYQLTTVEKLCSQVQEPVLFCGEIDAQDAELIGRQLGLMATVASTAASLRRAAYLAELGWDRLARGDSDNAATLSPIYLQHPESNA